MPVGNSSINNIRLQALKEGAMSLGARGALAWRSEHIDQALENESSYLTHIFDFNQLLLNQNVLPPVLVESQGDLTLDNNDTLRAANKTFKIVSEARFVTAPPTWQTYLWMSYQKPNVPSKALLPTNRAEAYAWNQFLKQGWQQGVNQANEIFSENLSRLKRDYLGMVLYRKLLAANMISSPIVSKAELGITGNKHEMRIDDAIMRITAHSALQLNSQKWNPILTK
jgi:defect in organelle trafficking protein DotC